MNLPYNDFACEVEELAPATIQLRHAIAHRLLNFPRLASMINGIYAAYPAEAIHPFLWFGPTQEQECSSKTSEGRKIIQPVYCEVLGELPDYCLTLIHLMRAALKAQPLTLVNANVIACVSGDSGIVGGTAKGSFRGRHNFTFFIEENIICQHKPAH